VSDWLDPVRLGGIDAAGDGYGERHRCQRGCIHFPHADQCDNAAARALSQPDQTTVK